MFCFICFRISLVRTVHKTALSNLKKTKIFKQDIDLLILKSS